MKTIRFLSLLALFTIIAVVGLTESVWAQRTLYVPTEYPTIQDAINAAVTGDTVQVAAGTYYGEIEVYIGGISLIGAGAEVTILDGQDNNLLSFGAESPPSEVIIIEGFTFTNANGSAISAGQNSILIKNCIFNNNLEGAVFVDEGFEATITNCSFSNNHGGEFTWEENSPITNMGSAVINNCTFSDNFATDGGAILTMGSLVVSDSTFKRNIADEGGAIALWGDVIITNCTFSENRSDSDGGAINDEGSTGIITNSTFSGNWTGDDGGAIKAGSGLVITNCTFWGNSVPEELEWNAGGICCGSPLITNSIIWGNSPFDLIGPTATYSVVGTGSTAGEGNISADPQFVDPEAGDFHLQSTSPCIDSGNNSAPEIPESDLEGNLRIADGNGDGVAIVDMGAYEFVPAPNTPVGEDVTVSFDSGVTVTFANVSISGETSVSTSSSGPPLPGEFTLGDPPIYYGINTTATYTPPVTVCITYDPTQYSDPNNLRLLHYENDAWVDVTISNDIVGHVICGEVDSFSLFVIAMGNVVYNFSGFFQPVENPPVLNVVNAGRAIPVKFSLDGDQGLDIFLPGYPASAFTACGTTAENAIEETVTAGSSSLSYDASTDQYIYVWKTDRAWTGTCRTLVLKLNYQTYHKANFRFK